MHKCGRAGFRNCRARLEAHLRDPPEWCVQKFLGVHQVIIIEVGDVKKLGPKGGRRDTDDVQFHQLAILFCTVMKTVLSLVSGENSVVIVDCLNWIKSPLTS